MAVSGVNTENQHEIFVAIKLRYNCLPKDTPCCLRVYAQCNIVASAADWLGILTLIGDEQGPVTQFTCNPTIRRCILSSEKKVSPLRDNLRCQVSVLSGRNVKVTTHFLWDLCRDLVAVALYSPLRLRAVVQCQGNLAYYNMFRDFHLTPVLLTLSGLRYKHTVTVLRSCAYNAFLSVLCSVYIKCCVCSHVSPFPNCPWMSMVLWQIQPFLVHE